MFPVIYYDVSVKSNCGRFFKFYRQMEAESSSKMCFCDGKYLMFVSVEENEFFFF